MTNTVTLTAPAKINLWLEIKNRRPDGYHNIESVMQTVTLCDTVVLQKAEAILLTCSEPTLTCTEKNLSFQAAKLFFEETGIDGGADIHIEKRIPVSGGLAGGSTDAAATLRGLNMLYESGFDIEQLCKIGVRIGADVPFCIRQGIAVTRGIGDRFSACAPLPDCHIVIACDGEGVSTPWAYGKLDEMYDFSARFPETDAFVRRLNRGILSEIAAGMTNIFESAVLPLHRRAEQLKEIMRNGGALRALMSGSGPSVFGIFDNFDSAEKTVRHLISLGIKAHLCKPFYPGK